MGTVTVLTFSSSSGAPWWLMHTCMLAAAGLGLLAEIPSCLVHLFRVGLRDFFPKLSCNVKMEIADSKGILSVVP